MDRAHQAADGVATNTATAGVRISGPTSGFEAPGPDAASLPCQARHSLEKRDQPSHQRPALGPRAELPPLEHDVGDLPRGAAARVENHQGLGQRNGIPLALHDLEDEVRLPVGVVDNVSELELAWLPELLRIPTDGKIRIIPVLPAHGDTAEGSTCGIQNPTLEIGLNALQVLDSAPFDVVEGEPAGSGRR